MRFPSRSCDRGAGVLRRRSPLFPTTFLCALDIIFVILLLLYWYLNAFSEYRDYSPRTCFSTWVKGGVRSSLRLRSAMFTARRAEPFKSKKSGKLILAIIAGGARLPLSPPHRGEPPYQRGQRLRRGCRIPFQRIIQNFDGAVLFQILLACRWRMFVFRYALFGK